MSRSDCSSGSQYSANRWGGIIEVLTSTRCFIAHGDCRQDAETLAKLIQEKNPPKKIIITPFDPTNGAHAGPGSLAIFFEGDEHARQH